MRLLTRLKTCENILNLKWYGFCFFVPNKLRNSLDKISNHE